LVKRLLQKIGIKSFGKCDSHCQSSIINLLTVKRSWMNQFQTLMNIIKRTPCFSGFVLCHLLVACHSMMATGKTHCRVYDPWLSQIYKQTIVWKWTGPLKILQYWYPNLNPYTKEIKAHFTLLRAPHITKIAELAKKVGEFLWFAKFTKVFSPSKLLLYGILKWASKFGSQTENIQQHAF